MVTSRLLALGFEAIGSASMEYQALSYPECRT